MRARKKERSVARGEPQPQKPLVRLFLSLIRPTRPTVPRLQRTLATDTITPLELPEIRTNIAKFLDRPDLVQCLYVCRAWHASFLPLVWSTVSIYSEGRYPGVEAFKSHSHLIRDLAYASCPWHAYKSTHCRNVSTLRVRCGYDVSPVIAQYDLLRQLSIIGKKQPRYGVYTCWKPTNSFRNLSSLDLYGMEIDLRTTHDFWDLCTRLKSLSISNTNIPRLPDKSMIFERLEKLELWPMPGDFSERRVEFITQCPNLVSLDWDRGEGPDGTPELIGMFASQLAKGTWPKLCELRILYSISSDKQLGQIVHGMQQVKSLHVDGRRFGPLTLTALHSHFSSLRQLKLENTAYTQLGPSIIPEVFVSFPQLEILMVGEVTSEELLQDQPWACEDTLKTLHACIIISPSEDMDHQQHLVLEKICRRLCHLEDFSLLRNAPRRKATYINLQLGKGLEHLANLKKLRRLGLGGRSNCMTKLT